MVNKNTPSLLFQNSPLAFAYNQVIFDEQGLPIDYKLVEMNPALEIKLGLNREEIMGKNISQWLFQTHHERVQWLSAFKDLVLTEGKREFEQMLRFQDRWYSLTAFVPEPDYLAILFQDHTSFHRTQLALEVSHSLSQSFFDHAPCAIAVYEVIKPGATSKDYILRDINPVGLKIENWRKKDVLGKSLGELQPEMEQMGMVSALKKTWDTGQATNYPTKVYSKGKEYRWFENIIFKLPSGEIVIMYNDITEQKQAEKELHKEKERLRITLYSIGDGVITTDNHGRVEMLNQIAEKLTGWQQKDATGKPLSQVFPIFNELTGKPCTNPAELVLETGQIVGLANHTILRSKDGREIAVADSAAPITNQQGETLGVVLVFRDVTEAKAQEEKIKFLSYRDALTGIYNRAFFEEELKRLNTEDQMPLTMIMGDLDGLKIINDVFGHQIGDEALVKAAQIISSSCRDTDIVSRWGGDEFVVLLPKTPEYVGHKICNRIKKISSQTNVGDAKLGISLGCATKTGVMEEWENIIKMAEDNMYKNKLLGAKSFRSIILTSMKNTLFEKSWETEEHGERLAYFCRKIGITMGLPSFVIDELEILAMLHDIGKIAIDHQILKKPGKLTEEEWRIIKKHPEIGYRIAQTVPELANIADYIWSHHERWDGQGYPRGLSAEDIPLLARILSVVDAYDAMTQERPYRQALTPRTAKEELKQHAGTQFDPQIVDIFLTYL